LEFRGPPGKGPLESDANEGVKRNCVRKDPAVSANLYVDASVDDVLDPVGVSVEIAAGK
jgi:hypothetical protein